MNSTNPGSNRRALRTRRIQRIDNAVLRGGEEAAEIYPRRPVRNGPITPQAGNLPECSRGCVVKASFADTTREPTLSFGLLVPGCPRNARLKGSVLEIARANGQIILHGLHAFHPFDPLLEVLLFVFG